MTVNNEQSLITIAQAGLRLGLSYQQVLRLVMVGQLSGRQTAGGRWVIDAKSVIQLARQRVASQIADREAPE
jgi:hypothetical protein